MKGNGHFPEGSFNPAPSLHSARVEYPAVGHRDIPFQHTAVANPVRLHSLPIVSVSLALPGLTARLDKLVYHHGGKTLPPDKPHAFVYFLTLQNDSEHTVTLLGRKWVIDNEDGEHLVIEGDKIVGETPRLAPGEQFSYNSYHIIGCNARVHGSFHGVDDLGRKIHVVLPPFQMTIPPETAGPCDV